MAIKDVLADPNAEWGQMGYFNIRLDKYQEERDLTGLADGDVNKYYRLTMAILGNAAPNFKRKDVPEEKIQELWKELFKIGNKVKSLTKQQSNAREMNKLMCEEELVLFNAKMTDVMHDVHMIFPKGYKRDPRKSSREGLFGGKNEE